MILDVDEILHEIEGCVRETKTLGLTEGEREIVYALWSKQSKDSYREYVNNFKACSKTDERRILDKKVTTNLFNHYCAVGE